MKTKARDYAATMIAGNWRLRKHHQRILAYAIKHSFLTPAQEKIQ